MTKVHIVSGVTSGVGKAVRELLIKKGDDVIPVVRSKKKAEEFKFSDAIVCDYSKPQEVETAFDRFERKIDSFINCAGTMIGKSIFELYSVEQLIDLTNINIISPMIAISKLKKNLKKGAVIVLFSSQSAFRGSYDDGYAASKGAMHTFVKSLSLKLAPHQRVVGIAPGIIGDTKMTEIIFPGEKLQKKIKTIPLQTTATSKEIAEVVEFVLSDSCRFMTGATIDINGGLALR